MKKLRRRYICQSQSVGDVGNVVNVLIVPTVCRLLEDVQQEGTISGAF